MFEKIEVGSLWNREALSTLWGYESYHALARGVVTPRNSGIIILFVSEEKPGDFTQYRDRLDGRRLQWEGEKGHRTDHRIANSNESEDQIHVFHRELHRAPFAYLGRARVVKFAHLTSAPSRAEFELID